ncbi:MAG: trypsin-like peptidase domain-containing protein [Planctomycetaceae bacterium]|jgi:serine protease Do|nr:trypsin-like peptidase domain-containing protein [Planctomycetaceae bacterium]
MKTIRCNLLSVIGLVIISASVTVRPCGVLAEEVRNAQEVEQAIDQANSLSLAFRQASKTVIPFVVKIQTSSPDIDPGLYGMFPFGPRSRHGVTGLGTGIIVSADGLILTNNHVVEDAKSITVVLSDGREYPAEDIKTDKDSDLALMQIKAEEPLPFAKFADSDKMEVGDWVLAIGNPFDLESSVSVGIISARWRPLEGVKRGDFLQTDAAINPGNSGGPLVNLRGEVVGINTAIASRTGSNSGIGFANASNTAKWVMQQLHEKGKVDRAYLGVQIETVTAELASKLGGKPREGVYVAQVLKLTSKENGLKADDIILTFDGLSITSAPQLQSVVERSDVNTDHQVQVLRNKKVVDLTVRVAHQETQTIFASIESRNNQQKPSYDDKLLGIKLMQVNPQYAKERELPSTEGVVIWDVTPGKRAQRLGLAIGMFVMKLNDTEIKTLKDYTDAREKASLEDGITLVLQSKEGSKTVVMKK